MFFSGKKFKYIEYLLLIIVCVVVYYPILNNDFLYYWDDQWMVMNEYTEGGLNFRNLKLLFSSEFYGQYAPLNQFAFLLIYNVAGYNSFYFHLMSLILHISCVCFVYTIILRLYNQQKQNLNLINENNIRMIVFITSLIFAVHPLNVESVAWISAVKVLFYSFFYLLATLIYLTYLNKGKIVFYILALLLFSFSFLGKEQAVTFPVWILLLYYILGYDLKDKKVWSCLIPIFVLSFIFCFITLYAKGQNVSIPVDIYPFWQRLVFACYSFVEYVTKFVFPYKLLYVYPFPMAAGEQLPAWFLLYPPLIIIIFVTLKNLMKIKQILYGVLFFLIHIVIALHIIPISRFAIVADRYIYLASIGLAFITISSFAKIIIRLNVWKKNLTIILMLLLCLYWSVYSNNRCREWIDSDSIKKDYLEIKKKKDVFVEKNEKTSMIYFFNLKERIMKYY